METSTLRHTVGARLDRLPLCRFHLHIIVLVGAGLLVDIFDIALGGNVLSALLDSGWSTMESNGTFLSVTFTGMLVGSWFVGIVGDRFGRSFSYQFNLALFGLASLAAAFAPNMTVLIVLRFVMGVGLGAEVVVGYSLISEFIPARSRGRWMVLLALVANSMLFVSSATSVWVIPRFGWQAMFVIVAVATLAIWVARKAMPESPRWLEAQGRFAEADAIVARAEASAALRGPLPPVPPHVELKTEKPVSVTVLLSPAVLRRTLLGMLLTGVMGIGLVGFVHWIPIFLVKNGLTLATSLKLTTLLSLGSPVGSAAALLWSDKIGRKTGIVAASVLVAVSSILLPFAMSNDLLLLALGFLLVAAIYASNALGFVVLLPELFPTGYRLRGAGACITFGRLVSALVPFIVLPIYADAGLTGVCVLVAVSYAAQAVLMAIFGIETKRRSLEELAVAFGETDQRSDAGAVPAIQSSEVKIG